MAGRKLAHWQLDLNNCYISKADSVLFRLNLDRLLVLQDIIQHSAKGELHVAQLESAARQMSAYAQSNRLKQLASLIVARTSPAEVH